MYSQYGDARFPPEYGPTQAPIPVDPSDGAQRYAYSGYYGSKAMENSQFGAMNPAHRAGQVYGGKPGSMVTREGMYAQNWMSAMQGQGYVGAPSNKQALGKADYPYSMQPADMYPGAAAGAGTPQGYPDSLHPPGMVGGFPPNPATYPGPPPPGFPPGQFPPYAGSSRGISPHPGMMHSSADMHGSPMDGYPEGMRSGMQGAPGGSGAVNYSGSGQWRSQSSAMNRANWNQDPSQGSGSSWPYQQRGAAGDGYPSSGPSTPNQPPPQRAGSQSSQQQQGGATTASTPGQSQSSSSSAVSQNQLFRQQSQQSFGALSPQTPYSNQELQKHGSVSSLRDALLANSSTSLQPPPTQPYNSPRVLGDHLSSPMTPSASVNLPRTPTDPLTPASGGLPLSPPLRQPSFVGADRQDSHASSGAETTTTSDIMALSQQQSISRQNSEISATMTQGGLVTTGEAVGTANQQLQVEDILGIKPVDSICSPNAPPPDQHQQQQQQQRLGMSSSNSLLGGSLRSPPLQESKTPIGEHHHSKLDSEGANSLDGGGGGRPDSLGFPVNSPSLVTQHSPLISTNQSSKVGKSRKAPIMSPVDRNHPSIANQYSFCEDGHRKEFLDTLFSLLEKEGIPLVRLPTVCKAPLDLFKVYNSVQELGGFNTVTEKRLWRDVLKSFNSTASNPNSGALRTLQQYYIKLLLPYECHVKKLAMSQCLSKLDSSLAVHSSSTNSSPHGSEKALMNHDDLDKSDADLLPEAATTTARVNGETTAVPTEHRNSATLNSNDRLSKRLDSQGSDSSSLMQDSQLNNNAGTPQDGHFMTTTMPSQPTPGSSSGGGGGVQNTKQDSEGFDFPDGSQNCTYSEDMTSADPLPEMSVQDTESILGISSYPSPGDGHPQAPPPPPQPPSVVGGDASTPSGAGGGSRNAPSPSYPPPPHFQPTPQHHQPPAATPIPSAPPTAAGQEFMDTMDMSSNTAAAAPHPQGMASAQHSGSNYPPSYSPMDPTGGVGGYHSHSPSHMTPGYSPYGVPSQYDIPPEFQHPGMMRSSYPGGGGGGPMYSMPPSMQMHPHRMMDYPSHYRSPGMPQTGGGAMGMRDVPPYPGGPVQPPPPPPGMTADWHWQHQRPRMLSSLPPHLHSSYPMYQQQRAMQQQQQQQQHSHSPRPQQHHHQQQAASMHLDQQQQQQQQLHVQQQLQHRASPVHHHPPGSATSQQQESIRIHWQEQMHAKNSNTAKLLEKANAQARFMHRPETSTAEMKAVPQKMEQQDGLKRSLPDWSNCVEGTKPKLIKRRRLFQNDCGHVEPWRVMMSLKSGLLSESTWALDTLNILLHDDRTIGFFYLKHHHSLLNTLVDHFKVILNTIFGDILETMDTYYPGNEGVDTKLRSVEGEKAREEMFNAKWLAEASTDDYGVLSEISKTGGERDRSKSDDSGDTKSEHENDRLRKSKCCSTQSIPIATVFVASEMKLGRSDNLSHIQLSVGNEDMFFPSGDKGREMMSEFERKKLENEFKLQRIDQTPVSELLHRETLQLPLNRYGRLGRSPRRRERSFLEELKRRESLSRSEEDHSSTSAGGKDGSEAESRMKGCVAMTSPIATTASTSELSASKSESTVSNFPGSSPVFKEESEIHQKEVLPNSLVPPSRDMLKARCICISNILRSLSFIPGNDLEFSQHSGILIVLGCLLTLHHHHLIQQKNRKVARPSFLYERSSDASQEDDDAIDNRPEEKHFGFAEDYWWWECLNILRENTLVILSNISGQLDFSIFPESISYPIIDGLLHWSVCPSAQATDPLPDTAMVSSLSPQRLVLETLAKISISEVNVDFILSTPPLPQLDLLFSHLIRFIGQKKHPVVRQFALVLLSNLAQGSEAASRLIGQQKMVVSLLLGCIESSEHASCASQGHLVGGYNPEDPNSLSVAMLRRAAATLHCLAKIPANRTAFLRYRDRTLYLATSQYVEPSVSSVLMDMLFELGKL